MTVLRTPDERFAALPGWPYAPRFLGDVGGTTLRLHYVDEGPARAEVTALCLHGNPTWGYLYRHMIPVFAAAGLRVVVPDLIGFGRSDKPADEGWHSFERHRDVLLEFVERLELRNILLVCQDWGGILGLTLPMAFEAPATLAAPAPEDGAAAAAPPGRFTRLLAMNTTLATGQVSEGFRQWRSYANATPDLPVGRLIARGKPDLPPAEAAGYDAPFPDASYKAALRAFPNLVPDGEHAPGAGLSRAAQAFWRERWHGASLMAIGLADPVLGAPVMRALHRDIHGGPPPIELPEAGHFVQEWGGPIAEAALRHFGLDPAHR